MRESTGTELTSVNRARIMAEYITHVDCLCCLTHLRPNAEEMGEDIIKTNDSSPCHTKNCGIEALGDIPESLVWALHC